MKFKFALTVRGSLNIVQIIAILVTRSDGHLHPLGAQDVRRVPTCQYSDVNGAIWFDAVLAVLWVAVLWVAS